MCPQRKFNLHCSEICQKIIRKIRGRWNRAVWKYIRKIKWGLQLHAFKTRCRNIIEMLSHTWLSKCMHFATLSISSHFCYSSCVISSRNNAKRQHTRQACVWFSDPATAVEVMIEQAVGDYLTHLWDSLCIREQLSPRAWLSACVLVAVSKGEGERETNQFDVPLPLPTGIMSCIVQAPSYAFL